MRVRKRRRRDEGTGDRRRAAQRPRVAAQHLPQDDRAAEAASAGAAGAASGVSICVRPVTVSSSSPVSIAQVVTLIVKVLVYFTLYTRCLDYFEHNFTIDQNNFHRIITMYRPILLSFLSICLIYNC